MKAISIRQPWAWLIVNGYKDIENRTWSTDYRGPILIHAAKTPDKDFILPDGLTIDIPKNLKHGGIVGEAVLIDCTEESNSPWFTGPYGLVLSGATPLSFSPCIGASKIFNLQLTGQTPRRAAS